MRAQTERRQSGFVSWDSPVPVAAGAQEELSWWIQWLRGWNGNSIIPPQTEVDLFSDASNTGYGGYMLQKRLKRRPRVVQGYWTAQEQQQSTNWKELVAAQRVVGAFIRWQNLRDCAVRLFTDNTVTYTYLNKMGGRVEHLRTVAKAVLEACEARRVKLVVEHLPGVQNEVADKLSRVPMDRSDWSLNRRFFRYLDFLWGPHSVDWFATRNNAQVPRFASWAADDQATYTDALQHLKQRENGYANPPFAIIGQVLQRIARTSRELTLIVPAWPAQHWWPLLLNLLVDTPLLLPDVHDLFTPPSRVGVHYTPLRPPWRCFACRISGRSSKRKAYRQRLRRLCALGGPALLTEIMNTFGEKVEGVL
jgi:hypothetical protein